MIGAGERIGSWIVERQLGEGGMGAVFLCRHEHSERIRAAVKVVKPGALLGGKERFLREVEALDALQHPAIVGLKGWGFDARREVWFLAMALVEGQPLDECLREGPLAVSAALRLFRDLADGLAHAHATGLYHRDLKPANVMVCTDGSGCVIDFGVVKDANKTALTKTGLVPGTLAYIGPEALDGTVMDQGRADVYALGLVLYEALRGEAAFPVDPSASDGQQMVHIVGMKMKAAAFDPGESVPDWLRDVVRSATDPAPDARPSMADFRAALEEPVAPTTDWYRTTPPPAASRVSRAVASSAPESEQHLSAGSSTRESMATAGRAPAPESVTDIRHSGGTSALGGLRQESRRGRRVGVLVAGLVLLGVGAVGVLVSVGAVLLVAAENSGTGPMVAAVEEPERGGPAEPMQPPESAERMPLPPDPVDELRAVAKDLATDGDTASLRARLQAVLPALLDAERPPITALRLFGPGHEGERLAEELQASPDGSVLLFDGELVVDEGLLLRDRRDITLIGLPDSKVFAAKGSTVLTLERVVNAHVHGMYLNHYASEIRYWEGDCDVFDPKLLRSQVLTLRESEGLVISESEIVGSGFIGIDAKNSEARVVGSAIHDCVAEAVKLTASRLTLEDAVVHDVGNTAYHTAVPSVLCDVIGCGPSLPGGPFRVRNSESGSWFTVARASTLAEGPSLVAAYKNSFTVDETSALTIDGLTLHNPRLLRGSRVFHSEGQLTVRNAVVSNGAGPLVFGNGKTTLSDVCTSAESMPEPVAGRSEIGWKGRFSAPKDALFDPGLPEEDPCAGLGATVLDGSRVLRASAPTGVR